MVGLPAGTTVGLMAVSLTHLSDGVTQLTSSSEWQSWAMAVGIDCMLIKRGARPADGAAGGEA